MVSETAGAMQAVLSTRGKRRAVATSSVGERPLVLNVALPSGEIKAEWREGPRHRRDRTRAVRAHGGAVTAVRARVVAGADAGRTRPALAHQLPDGFDEPPPVRGGAWQGLRGGRPKQSARSRRSLSTRTIPSTAMTVKATPSATRC